MADTIGVRKRDELIGEGMIRTGFLTEEQVDTVLQKQEKGDHRLFGQIALELGYIDPQTLISFLSAPEESESQ